MNLKTKYKTGQNMYKDMINKNPMKNEVDTQDINGNYIDPLFQWQPIRRQGNDIYFYSDIDHYSQLVLIQLLNDVQRDIISRNAMNMINGDMQEKIVIHICSYGGILSAGLALYDFIKNMQVTTVASVEGVAMSAATLILLACDERIMSDNSVVLIHQLSGGMWGTYSNMEDDKHNADKAMNKLFRIYLDETSIGVTEEMDKKLKSFTESQDENAFNKYYNSLDASRIGVLSNLLKHDFELDKEECMQMGIIDEENEQMHIELTEEDQEEIQKKLQQIINRRIKANTIDNMEKKVTKKKKTTTKKKSNK